MDLRFFVNDETYVLALWRCVYFSVWKQPVDAPHVRELYTASEEVARICPRGFVSLAIFEPGGYKVKGPEARAEVTRVSKLRPPNLLCVAQVVETTGFSGAAVRAALAGLNVVQMKTTPTRVFNAVEAASPWLAEYTLKADPVADAYSLLEAVKNARAKTAMPLEAQPSLARDG